MTSTPNTSGDGLLKGLGQLFKPRDVPDANSVFTNIGEATSATAKAVSNVLAATVDVPLGIVEAAIAFPNNAVGYLTTKVDEGIVRPMNKVRGSIYETLNNPGKTFSLAA
ncbi:MAG: hypothetical protein ABL890_03755 [Candidatus Peribacteraceae bacterium]